MGNIHVSTCLYIISCIWNMNYLLHDEEKSVVLEVDIALMTMRRLSTMLRF